MGVAEFLAVTLPSVQLESLGAAVELAGDAPAVMIGEEDRGDMAFDGCTVLGL